MILQVTPCYLISGGEHTVSTNDLHQRIYITRSIRTATTHRLTKSQLIQPLTACSVGSYTDGQVVQYTVLQTERGEVG